MTVRPEEQHPPAPRGALAFWLVAAACAVLSGMHMAWGVARGFVTATPVRAAPVALVLAACLWLAWHALVRHLAAARVTRGPYVVRHAGLVWSVAVWSALAYSQAIRAAPEGGPEERLWLFLLFGAGSAPILLWGGLLFRRVLTFGRKGREDEGDRR